MKTIKEIMEMIELQKEIIEKVLEVEKELNLDDYLDDIKKLTNHIEAADAKTRLKEKLDPDIDNFKILYCMLYSLRYTYEQYQKRNISDRIFIDTMKAFVRFLDEHYLWNKKWAFDRDWWIFRQLSMTLFRIGELEFEKRDLGDVKTISVHIPSDANLKYPKVIESIKASFDFFKEYYPDYLGVDYICRSWLLSSDLDNVLPKTSNIIMFKSLFVIQNENYNSKGFIKWIYKADYKDYNDLPEDTSLQRNLKKYLLDGSSISVAYGVLNLKKI